ncbi:Eukaryotic/viral aspartic protease [Phytophthora megakarya]|uniref:Eukaryotic/viral aspartic protease n=1 Tax=Phytophthora megakarya TaxID=4795 RepID=A0A225VYW9_9STRA|nr:Eukaryotic/viral aspartic protease [Phytophthora megakarya]
MVDKKDIAPEFQTLPFEPAIEAECVYACVGECEWPVESEVNCVISKENGLERSNTLGEEDIMRGPEDSLGVKTEGIVSSVVQETPRRRLNKEVRLLPGERMRWWSAQKFDRRVRMRTMVEGAVNDQRTRILLDTGANVSIV